MQTSKTRPSVRTRIPNKDIIVKAFGLTLAVIAALFLGGCGESAMQADTGDSNGSRVSSGTPTWSIQYEGKIVRRGKNFHIVDMYDVSSGDLATLRADGTKPIAYFSSQYEDWRGDASQFPKSDIGNKLDKWKGRALGEYELYRRPRDHEKAPRLR